MDELETQYRLTRLLGEDGFERMVGYPPFWFAIHQIRVWRAQVHDFGHALGLNKETTEPWMSIGGVSLNDVETLLTTHSGGTAWHQAAVGVARKFPNPLASPPARRAFARRLRESDVDREALLESLVVTGIYLAFSGAGTPQRIRLGRNFLQNSRGIVAAIKPNDGKRLGLFDMVGWIIKETRNAVEAGLLERPYPDLRGQDALDKPASFRSEADQPQTSLDSDFDSSTGDHFEDLNGSLDLLREELSKRELELLSHLENNPDITNPEIARRMGLASSTVRVMRLRIRAKANAVRSAAM